MIAVLARLRSDVRAGWRSWLSLAVLIGLFSGVVLMAAIGARRTATAYPRFLEAVRAEDLLMSPAKTGIGSYYEVLGDHPDVETIGVIGGAALFPVDKAGQPEFTANVFM